MIFQKLRVKRGIGYRLITFWTAMQAGPTVMSNIA